MNRLRLDFRRDATGFVINNCWGLWADFRHIGITVSYLNARGMKVLRYWGLRAL